MTEPLVVRSEIDDAVRLANAVLDKPFIDPDGDICLLARQFLRHGERLARLQAENEALRRERDEARTGCDETSDAWHRERAARAAAEARAARLEEALAAVHAKALAGLTNPLGLTREDAAFAACSFIEETSRVALEAK